MRLQLALDVSDIDEAVDFYSKLFATEPYKRKQGYANFEIAQPPLKLVLFENPDGGGTINHLGVETETADEVVAAEARLSAAGLETSGVGDTTCCFADKVETWVHGPDSMRWEWYLKAADREEFGTNTPGVDDATAVGASTGGNACCG